MRGDNRVSILIGILLVCVYWLIFLLFGGVGLTVIAAFIYFPMIFYNYLIYVPIDFWKRFWADKPKILLNIFQLAFYSIFYIIFIIFFNELFQPRFDMNIVFKIIGGVSLSIGLFISFTAVKKLNILRTTFVYAVYRDKTKDASPLVTSGIYKYVRNPMYTTDVIILTSVFLISGTYFSALLAILYIIQLYPFVRLEEKELMESFGESYARYCKETPRFIPNISKIFPRGR